MKDQTAFSTRFARHKDELEWLFMELYNNREGLEVLEREMADAYDARSAELKALDKARAADPNWYKRGNMFGMTMYTDLFAGNLKELAKKLPYFKEQKLTYLHLMPLLQMPHPHNDGGYAVEDFDTVDPALGTNKDLENLTRELRKHQMAGSQRVFELHGSVHRNICQSCGAVYSAEWICSREHEDAAGVPVCPACGGRIKPDVVLYEEPLDERVLTGAVAAIAAADALIVGGTSLVVYPAAGLTRYFTGDTLAICNLAPTDQDANADLLISCDIAAAFAF